jgi:hypothetical protein
VNTTVVIRHADHVAPSIRKKLAITSKASGGHMSGEDQESSLHQTLQNSSHVSVSGNVSSMHIRYEQAVSCNDVSGRTFMQLSSAYCGFANCGLQVPVVLHMHLVSSTALRGLMYPRCLTLSTDGRNRWRRKTSTAVPRSPT